MGLVRAEKRRLENNLRGLQLATPLKGAKERKNMYVGGDQSHPQRPLVHSGCISERREDTAVPLELPKRGSGGKIPSTSTLVE